MIRQLQPWHENLGKRQVKAPKIYFRDTGLLPALCIAQPDQACFWATHQGAELDLLMFKGGQ